MLSVLIPTDDSAADLQALIHANPNVRFSIKVDAPYTKPFVDLLAKEPNVLLAETAAGSDGTSFGFLPYVTTLSGKKLEVPIKKLLRGAPLEKAANISSVDDPDALRWFERFAASRLGSSG